MNARVQRAFHHVCRVCKVLEVNHTHTYGIMCCNFTMIKQSVTIDRTCAHELYPPTVGGQFIPTIKLKKTRQNNHENHESHENQFSLPHCRIAALPQPIAALPVAALLPHPSDFQHNNVFWYENSLHSHSSNGVVLLNDLSVG